jgi:hypothetical protein
MRINSNGNLFLATTSITGSESRINLKHGTSSGIWGITTSSTGSDGYPFVFYTTSGQAGYVYCLGTITSYVTTSDYRLKENITPMADALSIVTKLKPVTYQWKTDGSNGQGFIAHELQEFVPECVVGEKDAVDTEGNPKYQGIDTSFLVATLTAAIQELNAKVDAQAAEIAALKNPTNGQVA